MMRHFFELLEAGGFGERAELVDRTGFEACNLPSQL